MKTKSILISGLLIFTLLLSACGSKEKASENDKKDTESTAENAGDTAQDASEETITLKIGTHGSFSPYAFIDENSDAPQGYEIDLMNEIAERKNLDVTLEVAE